ncbi:MAG: redox-sensing transcriptional repressor Rex [Lachnospiraceae bacterium]|nr:redox-sensing transcriptional repressor Rex [Lachnospiraceae bacterium]
MEERRISKAVIKRLPRYYRYLGEMLNNGVERISSGELSSKMQVTASQIRQDLNNFGGFGQQGYGYNVKYLHDEIGKILGVDKMHPMIIIGGGNFGHELANYDFAKSGFETKAVFDVKPELVGTKISGIPVMLMDDLEDFIEREKVEIAILTLPKSRVQEVATRLVNCGVKALWNFAHLDLDVPDDVVVENVHLVDSLMQLSYRIVNDDSNGMG